jgi:hypothetical protein
VKTITRQTEQRQLNIDESLFLDKIKVFNPHEAETSEETEEENEPAEEFDIT